jgi:hypothetical protein
MKRKKSIIKKPTPKQDGKDRNEQLTKRDVKSRYPGIRAVASFAKQLRKQRERLTNLREVAAGQPSGLSFQGEKSILCQKAPLVIDPPSFQKRDRRTAELSKEVRGKMDIEAI